MLTVGRNLNLLSDVAVMRFMSRLWMPITNRVVIIGGGLVGLEMAEFLIERGRKVIVLEPSSTLAPELSIVRRSRVIHLLKEHGAELVKNAIIDEITPHHVAYSHEGESKEAPGEQVIIALGAEPNTEFATEYENAGFNVTAIGDCQSIGYIDGAIHNAREAVANI
jgi:2,4-dienoyl-CoA reductase (NADPH2)